MRNLFLCGLLATSLAVPSTAFALKVAMLHYQTGQKAAMAEAVVVGKVTSIEADRVELEMYPGSQEKGAFQIAVIKIETGLVGAKNITHIKVAFAPVPVEGAPNNGGAPGRPFRPAMGPVPLTEGQEGLFFLVPHNPGSTIRKIPAGMDPVLSTAANYKEELAKVQLVTDTLADPGKALKAAKLEDRQAAASILATKYAAPPMDGTPSEQAPLGEELSKAILATILELDWKTTDANNDTRYSGPVLASRWGLSPGSALGVPKVVVKPGENYNVTWKKTLQDWAKANPEKVVLKKYVPKAK